MSIQHDPRTPPSDRDGAPALRRAAQRLGDCVVGWERSLKWRLDEGGRDDQRWVFGFRTQGLDEEIILSILRELGVPLEAETLLRAMWPAVHFAYLGAESGGFKVYLEFPVRLKVPDRRGQSVWAPPGLWAQAFKWRSDSPLSDTPFRQTEYWLVPGVTLESSRARIALGDPDHPMLDGLSAIARQRPLASNSVDAVTLYEIRHSDGGRAWDLNLYAFNLQIDDALASALGLRSVPQTARGAVLGHFTAGRDRDGQAYRSVYWPVPPPD
ncbi:MAG: hypothetical protein RL322_1471 [Pseudomonadota bacterium]